MKQIVLLLVQQVIIQIQLIPNVYLVQTTVKPVIKALRYALSCSSSIRILAKGTCQCLEKYVHLNGECYECDSSCATCSGADSDECLTCTNDLYL